MRVGLITWGTEGDVRPFFALGRALRARGHEVELVTSNLEGHDHQQLAASLGLDSVSVGTAHYRAHREAIAKSTRDTFEARTALGQLRVLIEEHLEPVIPELEAASVGLAERCDVVVGHFLVHPASAAALAKDKPYVAVALQPIAPTRFAPPIGMPSLGPWLNRITWRLSALVLERVLLPRVNATRARLGVAPTTRLFDGNFNGAACLLVGLSPSLFPRPADWDDQIVLPGFFEIATEAQPWEPDAALREFLDAGTPPVFLSFGSMFPMDLGRAEEAVEIFVEALGRAGARGIVQAPSPIVARRGDGVDRERVHFVERAPHGRLFPLCSAIVHHGGAGTTQTALLAGRPSVIVPHVTDQFFFGEVLRARGVASAPLPRRALDGTGLARRIGDVLGDPGMATRAAALGARMADERGAERAAERLEDIAQGRG